MANQRPTDARDFVFVLAMMAAFSEAVVPVSADDDADVTFFETRIRQHLSSTASNATARPTGIRRRTCYWIGGLPMTTR